MGAVLQTLFGVMHFYEIFNYFGVTDYCKLSKYFSIVYVCMWGTAVAQVLCYKSEGRWFDPSWCQWVFH